jgi:hypothetical protein
MTGRFLVFALAAAVSAAAHAQAGLESAKAGSDAAFASAAGAGVPLRFEPRLERAGAAEAGRRAAVGRGLWFTVENRLAGEWSVFGSGVSLTVREKRRGFDDGVYEITGAFLGRQYGFDKPLVVRREEFGGSSKTILEGGDLRLAVERRMGWPETGVEMTLAPGVPAELAAALAGIMDMLPTLRPPTSSFPGSPAPIPGGRTYSYRFRESGTVDSFYVDGRDANLRVQRRDWAGKATFEATGTALGRRLGLDRKSTRLNSSHRYISRMPSSA